MGCFSTPFKLWFWMLTFVVAWILFIGCRLTCSPSINIRVLDLIFLITSFQLWRHFTLQKCLGITMLIFFNRIKGKKLVIIICNKLFHVLGFLLGHLTCIVQSLILIVIHETTSVTKRRHHVLNCWIFTSDWIYFSFLSFWKFVKIIVVGGTGRSIKLLVHGCSLIIHHCREVLKSSLWYLQISVLVIHSFHDD